MTEGRKIVVRFTNAPRRIERFPAKHREAIFPQ